MTESMSLEALARILEETSGTVVRFDTEARPELPPPAEILSAAVALDLLAEKADALATVAPIAGEEDPAKVDIRNQIAEMTIGQKIKVALFGNQVCRMILIRDANKMIQLLVLKNAKIAATEIEEFARNPQASEAVLRGISDNKQWMKSYSLKLSIVTNPKTPPDVALKWLRFLNAAELKRLARSKNVPQLVSVTARKRYEEIGES